MWRCSLWLVGLVAILQGCGTITRGSSEAWVVESDPPGAEVEVSTGHRCRTPCSIELKRKNGFVAKITREGYEPVEAVITRQTAGAGAAAMAGNIFFGGLIGVAVDAGTGANKELKPNPLQVRLVPLAPPPVPASDLPVAQAPAPAPVWRQLPALPGRRLHRRRFSRCSRSRRRLRAGARTKPTTGLTTAFPPRFGRSRSGGSGKRYGHR